MPEYANVWPENGLFAFSGIDGETCHAEPFVGSGTRDGIGWRYWVNPPVVFQAELDGQRLVASPGPDDFIFSDCWRCAAVAGNRRVLAAGAFLDRASMLVALTSQDAQAECLPDLRATREGRPEGNTVVFEAEGCWLAVSAEDAPPTRRLGIAVSYKSKEEAVARANQARTADLDEAMRRRLAFYEAVRTPKSVWAESKRAYYKAAGIHKVNTESAQLDIPCRWTTPDRMPHRHMWLWDSAFHSLGLMHLRTDLAEDAITALFAKQRADGKLLLAAQPGTPPREESDTQPPIVAWAVWRQVRETGRMEFAERLYPYLVRYIEWFEANRKNANGLYGWRIRTAEDAVCGDAGAVRGARGGESGMDNSPRFDDATAMTAVDLSSYMAAEYLALERMAKSMGKGGDANEWHNRRERISALVNELLWDDESRFYYDLDQDGCFILVKTPAGFMPLLGRIADRNQAESLRLHLTNTKEFWAPLPVPSVSQDEDTFSNDMWRGPTWMSTNLLIYYGMDAYGFLEEARAVAHRSMNEITRWYLRHGCFYECYDALGEHAPCDLPRKGGVGAQGALGFGVIEDLHWAAAAFIHFAHAVA